jgi:hypothetical protein
MKTPKKSIEKLPVSEWVAELSKGSVVAPSRHKKALKKEFYEGRKNHIKG